MKKEYWYKFYIEECVLCWKQIKWKERQYTKKPKDSAKRYDFKQFACESHF